jgi:hypothetical protein
MVNQRQQNLGDGSGKKAKGVYVLRHPTTGRIYKVGKADSTGLVGRLESYAKDWVASGVQVKAEVYPLSASGRSVTGRALVEAERVLRQAVREDGWSLNSDSGAADGTWDEIEEQGTGGWNAVSIQ